MIQNRLRAPVTRLITPVCELLLKLGLTANMLTTIGAVGVVAASFSFLASGELFIGTLLITIFALSDLLDGTMARISKSNGSKWGAFLDSTLDRISDAAICIGLWLYFRNEGLIAWLLLLNLFLGGLIPYIRAKAEALSIKCDVGIAERVERLIIILIGSGLYGLGVTIAMPISLIVLTILSLITVLQRIRVVYRAGK
ncbi:MAG: phosphatidylinositol phosphate synthase [Candidatus Nanopelagicaceae bacterium]